MKRLFKEEDLQKAQVKYLEGRRKTVRDVMFCAIPNESSIVAQRGKVNFRLAQHLRDMGLVSGAPDLIVWRRGRAFYIENKVKGRKLSEAQEAFGEGLLALGHEYHVITAETPGDAVNQLEALLGGQGRAA